MIALFFFFTLLPQVDNKTAFYLLIYILKLCLAIIGTGDGREGEGMGGYQVISEQD